MGNINTFLTEEDYIQIHEETGCKEETAVFRLGVTILLVFIVTENQIRRLYSRFAHLDKRSKGYLV